MHKLIDSLPNPYSSQSFLKKLIRQFLNFIRINFRKTLTPGISLFGFNFFIDYKKGGHKFRSAYALDFILRLNPKSVLDVGSGGGYHAQLFSKNGGKVVCIDYGSSVYAKNTTIENLEIIKVDFNKFEPTEKFDVVWASHILEHQRNIGIFIEKLILCCNDNGVICLTVPDPHRSLLGGHVSIWSPGLLAYNVILCGIDLSESKFIRGTNEFSIIFHPKRICLPSDLSYDFGDIEKLSAYFPCQLNEGGDPWKILYTQTQD